MPSNPFALPRGLPGHVAGRLMARTNDAAQHQVAGKLPVRSGERVLEIGYGPGQLTRSLLESTPAALVAGVDPSEVMLRQARRACGPYVNSGRADLRLGDAAHLPFPDGYFDHAVSVNTVALWPHLEAGLGEVNRVLRAGGTMLIAWHSASSPSRVQRLLALPEERLAAIERAVADTYGSVDRLELGSVTAFVASR